mmetsp:Transcript_96217/g.271961  ORF Transcript_96217/g.271961 Transcript_96217/m.271961 type:complete len:445 (+) Transcript_96217:93-1427(+)
MALPYTADPSPPLRRRGLAPRGGRAPRAVLPQKFCVASTVAAAQTRGPRNCADQFRGNGVALLLGGLVVVPRAVMDMAREPARGRGFSAHRREGLRNQGVALGIRTPALAAARFAKCAAFQRAEGSAVGFGAVERSRQMQAEGGCHLEDCGHTEGNLVERCGFTFLVEDRGPLALLPGCRREPLPSTREIKRVAVLVHMGRLRRAAATTARDGTVHGCAVGPPISSLGAKARAGDLALCCATATKRACHAVVRDTTPTAELEGLLHLRAPRVPTVASVEAPCGFARWTAVRHGFAGLRVAGLGADGRVALLGTPGRRDSGGQGRALPRVPQHPRVDSLREMAGAEAHRQGAQFVPASHSFASGGLPAVVQHGFEATPSKTGLPNRPRHAISPVGRTRRPCVVGSRRVASAKARGSGRPHGDACAEGCCGVAHVHAALDVGAFGG